MEAIRQQAVLGMLYRNYSEYGVCIHFVEAIERQADET
jgi:hypothetical protein